MLTTSFNINSKTFFKRVFLFSTSNRKKVQQVGFKSDDIFDAKKLSYVTNQKIEYIKGRFLIYKYKKSLLEVIKRYFLPLSFLSNFTYLLWTKPYLAFFPAATPILWILELLTLYLLGKKYKRQQSIISEIYLLEGGSSTQIHFANSQKRRLFGENLCQTFYNTLFVNPTMQAEDISAFNLHPFPQQISDFEKAQYGNLWTKYFSNGDNFFLIPKKYEIMNKQILVIVNLCIDVSLQGENNQVPLISLQIARLSLRIIDLLFFYFVMIIYNSGQFIKKHLGSKLLISQEQISHLKEKNFHLQQKTNINSFCKQKIKQKKELNHLIKKDQIDPSENIGTKIQVKFQFVRDNKQQICKFKKIKTSSLDPSQNSKLKDSLIP